MRKAHTQNPGFWVPKPITRLTLTFHSNDFESSLRREPHYKTALNEANFGKYIHNLVCNLVPSVLNEKNEILHLQPQQQSSLAI